MRLQITTADDDTFTIEEFDAATVLDLRDDLDNADRLFVQFEMDGQVVLLNKIQIVSIEIS